MRSVQGGDTVGAMEVDEYEDGVPSWVDLTTSSVEDAGKFYGGLFGWKLDVGPPEAGGYAMASLKDRPVAGIAPSQEAGGPVYWTTYVNVASADDAAKKVTDNGGSVMLAPMDVMDVGRLAVFGDPTGAAFAVWQAGAHKGAGLVNEDSTYSWSELVTTDVEGAKTFYAAVFGWGADTHGEGPGAYTEWKIGDRSVGGMMEKSAEMPAEVPSHWQVYFTVKDADAAVAKVKELGGSVSMGPMEIEPGSFAVCLDPQGATFNIIQPKEEPG
jgi:predicted enzyme related to lactoylglutathione lyase